MFEATDENDLNLAIAVFREGMHMDAQRSSDVEVPTESLVPYSWRKMLASSQMKDVRCRSWTFINVRVRGVSGSSGLSVFFGLVAGFRMSFVSGLVEGFWMPFVSAACPLSVRCLFVICSLSDHDCKQGVQHTVR